MVRRTRSRPAVDCVRYSQQVTVKPTAPPISVLPGPKESPDHTPGYVRREHTKINKRRRAGTRQRAQRQGGRKTE